MTFIKFVYQMKSKQNYSFFSVIFNYKKSSLFINIYQQNWGMHGLQKKLVKLLGIIIA